MLGTFKKKGKENFSVCCLDVGRKGNQKKKKVSKGRKKKIPYGYI
jgi:hypothetical protein